MTKQPQAAQAAASGPRTARTGVRAPRVRPAPSRAVTAHQAPTEAENRAADVTQLLPTPEQAARRWLRALLGELR